MPRRVEGALDDDDAAIRGQSDAFVAKRKDLALLPFAHDAYCRSGALLQVLSYGRCA
jgi:hypothetical protein